MNIKYQLGLRNTNINIIISITESNSVFNILLIILSKNMEHIFFLNNKSNCIIKLEFTNEY